jgi:hypothetical protein
MGRKKLYKDNAEKLRVWRLKKKLESNPHARIRMDVNTREKVKEVIEPEVKKVLENLEKNPYEDDFSKMTEEEFIDYIDANEKKNAWLCPECEHLSWLYKEYCEYCPPLVSRPEEYQEQAEWFLEKYPVARKWVNNRP